MPDDAAAPDLKDEMQAEASLRLGDFATIQASARTTPAGLVATGFLVAAVLLSTAALVLAAGKARAAGRLSATRPPAC
jgi:hypothetical protein